MTEPQESHRLSDLPLSDDEIIKIAVTQLGMTESYARFVLAMERGQIHGDVIFVDEPSRPKPRKPRKKKPSQNA